MDVSVAGDDFHEGIYDDPSDAAKISTELDQQNYESGKICRSMPCRLKRY